MSLFAEVSQEAVETLIEFFDYLPDMFMFLFVIASLFHFFMVFLTNHFEKDKEDKVILVKHYYTLGLACLLPVFTYAGVLYFTNYTKWKAFILVFVCFVIKRILCDIYGFFFAKEVQ